MSPSIWTRCGGRRNARTLALDAWRVVESQYVTSTRKLVDSSAEQDLLEQLIDGAKPPVPAELAALGLHYLLFTPFRHPPLRNGSRFGTRFERGIFYGSLEVETALAEVAYYRLLFLEGTKAELGLVETEHTAFRVAVRTDVGIDLTVKPFVDHEAEISSPTDYAHAQELGRELRQDGIEVCLFTSARASSRSTNLALFAPAFARKAPVPADAVADLAVRGDALGDRAEAQERHVPAAGARVSPQRLSRRRAPPVPRHLVPTPRREAPEVVEHRDVRGAGPVGVNERSVDVVGRRGAGRREVEAAA